MKRRTLKFIVSFVVIITSLTVNFFADAKTNSVVFINADINKPIKEIADLKNIKAEVKFVPEETGKASIITAGYDSMGMLVGAPVIDVVDVDAGQTKVHETTPISTTGTDNIKVFIWNINTMSPILERNGALQSVFSSIGRTQKFNLLDGVTEDSPYIVADGMSVNAGQLFEAIDGTEINSKFFDISVQPVGDSEAHATFVPDTEDWTNSTLSFNGTGLLKLTAQDYDFCVPTDTYVNVISPIDRYITKFEHTDKFLYRVGNSNTVSLSSLFAATESELPFSGVEVTVNGEVFSGDVSGIYTPNSDWTKGTIKFDGTGVVSVTIQDDYSNPVTLMLEVVDAKNITKAESATSNNVVLLNDASGTFTVSNGHTFYGNGFTVKLPTDSVQNVGQGFTGYVSIGSSQDDGSSSSGGNLDNVRIEGPVYPEMYIYRDQAKITDKNDADYGDGYNMRYFRNSVIVYGGNCTISNSYISGSRTALCLRGGNNVVIDNTTLSGGAYANMQICAGSSVTLRNLTTVQTDVADSYNKSKTAHGLGIAVDSSVVDVYIEGELNQYNWLCQEQWNNIVPSSYQSNFPSFFTNDKFSKYWHYLNGGVVPYVNMTFIYACNWDTEKIHDNRTTVNYGTCAATIAGVAGGVYSKINTVGGNAITDSDLASLDYVSSGFNPVAPNLNFDNAANNDADDENDAADTYCVYDEGSGILKIGMNGSSKVIDLSGVTVTKNGSPLSFTKYLNGTEISGNSVEIKSSEGTKQVLKFKTTTNDCGYDKDGNPISGSIEYTWTVNVEVATLSYPAPVWNMGGTYKFNTSNCVYAYYATSSGYGEAVPIYEGIKINYYNKNGELVNLDLSGTTTLPTGSNNSNTNAFTYTLSDGSILTMKFASGWKSGATTHQFTNYNNKVYIYPQSLDNDNYIRAKVGNQNFDVKINYIFTDPNGQSTDTVTMNWYNDAASNGNVTTVQWKTFDSSNGRTYSPCVTGDTLVTLADGRYKRIDEITSEDELLVWDFYKGEYATVPSAIISNHGYSNNTVIKLVFDDGTEVKVTNLHQFFDAEFNRLVTIDADSVAEYVGHSFVKRDGDTYKTVKLLDYSVSNEYVEAYGIISALHYNILVEDMFSADYPYELYNLMTYFEVGENMVYDKDLMTSDINTYGLYSYKEFDDYITKEQFDAMNIKYMKIPVEKGYYTYEGIILLTQEYLK